MKKIIIEESKAHPFIKPLRIPERDIINLQEAFLTPGLHFITTYNRSTGRILINALLKSLKFYRVVACLTPYQSLLPNDVVNIYQDLEHQNYDGHVQDFILDEMSYGFLWIEETDDLKGKPWFRSFRECLIDFGVDKMIPIVTVVYSSNVRTVLMK